MSTKNVKITLLDEQAWKEARLQRISGHDAVAIAGFDPYADLVDVWREKAEGLEKADNFAMQWGRENEGKVLEKLHKAVPELANIPVPSTDKRLTVLDDWRIGTPDALYLAEANGKKKGILLEAKTTKHFDPEDRAKITAWIAQVGWYLLLIEDADIKVESAFIGILNRDDGAFSAMRVDLNEAKGFWPETTLEFLKGVHRAILERQAGLLPGIHVKNGLMQRYVELAEKIKALQAEQEQIKEQLIPTEATTKTLPIIEQDHIVGVVKQIQRTVIDTTRLRKEEPAIASRFLKQESYFRVMPIIRETGADAALDLGI
jgi:hypothetical protein